MDFYKKIVKNKDATSVVSEKEYKCVSLQAITNEAIKENNKKRLKELVEEINGHLADLRPILGDKDPKNKAKCEKLITQYQECLVRIVNTRSFDAMATITGQLQELQNLTEKAIRDNNLNELKKLAEKMERNIAVVKEIPEVKSARNGENGNEKFLEEVNKYTSLLNKVLAHINVEKRRISGPINLETNQKNVEENIQEQESLQPKPNKVALNEVEEKLKLMRQKRLNRQSTFIEQQVKLSEERSREGSPSKSSKTVSQDPERVENKTAIKSIPTPGMIKPSLYKAAAQEKLVKAGEQKAFSRNEKKDLEKIDEKPQAVGFVGSLRASFGKGIITGDLHKKSLPETSQNENKEVSKEVRISSDNSENVKKENSAISREVANGVRSSFGKGELSRSFAERHIENARNQTEKPKGQLKASNSTKTSPPRSPKTPTQIRKIFNSFNSCVMGTNNNKSIEDLPGEFKSPFEQELKTVQLKNTGLANRLDSFKENNNSEQIGQESSNDREPPPPLLPRKTPFLFKPTITTRRLVRPRQGNWEYDEVNAEEKVDGKPRFGGIEKSASQSQIISSSNEYQDEKGATFDQKKSWRKSLDYDAVIVRHNESDLVKQPPTDCTITIKRESNPSEPPPERRSFSTFRSSTNSVKDEYAVSNPLYGVVTDNQKQQPFEIVNKAPTITLNRQNSVSMDTILTPAKTRELIESDFNILSFLSEEIKKKSRRMSYRNEQSHSNRLIAVEPDITKLEYVIKIFRGLKRDDEYFWIDKLLSKYYVKVDEVSAQTAFDNIEKDNLLERLKKASSDLEARVTKNEDILKAIFEEQTLMIADNHGIA